MNAYGEPVLQKLRCWFGKHPRHEDSIRKIAPPHDKKNKPAEIFWEARRICLECDRVIKAAYWKVEE